MLYKTSNPPRLRTGAVPISKDNDILQYYAFNIHINLPVEPLHLLEKPH
jgi:hypothetical protein